MSSGTLTPNCADLRPQFVKIKPPNNAKSSVRAARLKNCFLHISSVLKCHQGLNFGVGSKHVYWWFLCLYFRGTEIIPKFHVSRFLRADLISTSEGRRCIHLYYISMTFITHNSKSMYSVLQCCHISAGYTQLNHNLKNLNLKIVYNEAQNKCV